MENFVEENEARLHVDVVNVICDRNAAIIRGVSWRQPLQPDCLYRALVEDVGPTCVKKPILFLDTVASTDNIVIALSMETPAKTSCSRKKKVYIEVEQ